MASDAGCREPKSRAGWINKKRRFAFAPVSAPCIISRHDNSENLLWVCASAMVRIRSNNGVISIDALAFDESDASMALLNRSNNPRKLGSRHKDAKKGCASANLSLSSYNSSISRYNKPFVLKNSSPAKS